MKNDFDMLNEVVIDMTEHENCVELNYIERKRIKKRIKNKLRNKKPFQGRSAVVVVCASLLLYAGIQTDAKAAFYGIASNIPIVRGILEIFVGESEQQIADYKTTVGQTVSDNGVDVRLNEVLLDTGRLIISSTFQSNTINLEEVLSPFPTVYLNGNEVLRNGGGNKTKIDDKTYSFISAVNLGDTAIEGELDIQIVYKDLQFLKKGKHHAGNWGFTLQTSAERILGDTRTILINKSFLLENGQEIQISNLELSPVSTRINYKILNGYDSDVLFQVQDSDGTQLEPVSATTLSENSHIRFPKLNKQITKITVTPYVITGKEGGDNPKEKTFLYKERFEVDIK